jgi:hypothetical protein
VNGTRDLKLYNCIRANGGWYNWTIEKLEYFICENTIQSHKRERELIELHKPSLNIYIPSRTVNEWYKENSVKLNEQNKKWCKENPNYFKEWRLKHPGYTPPCRRKKKLNIE